MVSVPNPADLSGHGAPPKEDKELEQSRQLKDKELEIQRNQLAAGRWTGPVAVAVVAGILGLIGSFISLQQNRELERKKQEGTVILEAIRTGSTGKERERQVAANLVFFADAGLVSLGSDQLKKLRDRAGDASPALPPVAGPASIATIPDSVRQRILKTFDDFGKYFETLGLNARPKVGVEVATEPGSIAYYDPARLAVFISNESLGDPNVPLREYAHAVLYSDEQFKDVDYNRTWVYFGIESGLASYFSSSFRDDSRIPPNDLTETLENQRKLNELKPGPSAMWDGTLAWGAAFWDLRKALGKSVADRLLYESWAGVTSSEISKNDPTDFVRHILAADARLDKGQHAKEIQTVFSERGVTVPH